MVEYQENPNRSDDAGAQTPVRRRRTFRPMAAADSIGVAPAETSPAQPEAAADVTPPAPVPTMDRQVPEGATEVGEEDVIVPPTPTSTQPAAEPEPDEAAEEPEPDAPAPAGRQPARPPLAVLFQAPPALPEPAEPPLPRRAERVEPDFEDETDDDEGDAGQGGRRSRRRTRRRGGAAEAQEGEQQSRTTEVVAKVRPAREPITEPQRLKGSTRLEAKRQRRRDGRDAGRRRTVVTEAEFLARREAVDRVMLVRNHGDRIEIGVLEDGILAEHYVAKSQNVSLIGNVYLGRVQNVLPSMEAAFVDIGRGRNAVLYSGEVDWEAASDRLGEKGSQARRIELALKSGDTVLVQVTKDPIGHKGARLTSAVSLPGRYLVYVPNGSMNGISRKLPDTERARLKKILKDALPDSAGVIVRTAAEGATEEQLTIDVQRLANQWAEIEHLVQTAQAPTMLHGEPDLLVKIVRDVFNEDFARLIVEGEDARATIERYLSQVAPDLLDRLEPWTGDTDVFSAHRVNEQIEKALDRKVWLPSGGSLVIDRTEAMTVIDVNTGKFVGSGGNLEETVTMNNLEAAEEIVRQLRLRDIGGIIVVDFIDMVLESNRDLVLRRLVECLSRDRTKHQVAEVTSLGLVQMTRKRLGVGLAESVGDAPAPDAKPEPNRRRRGGGGQAAPAQQPSRPAATHTITDGAKTALAQIAGATIVPSRHGAPEQADSFPPVAEAIGLPAESPEPAERDEQGPRRERASRRGRGRGRGENRDAQPAESVADEAPAHAVLDEEPVHTIEDHAPASSAEQRPARDEPPVTAEEATAVVLGVPIAVHERPAARLETIEAAGLLDSVLDALPAPRPAGQGRRRSRRVSTPALTPGHDD